jgi:AraC-like DNA-binding protein
MLTANTSLDHQLAGLECGADVYLTKPFSVQILQTYISNLLKSCQVVHKYYEKKSSCGQLEVEVGTVDKKFIETLTNVIDENLSNIDFDVSELSKEVGLSKTALYKKFNAIAHTSIAEFIKRLRLQKAALLLSRNKLNVSNTAWEVGFSNRRYFSREFKKLFGNTPSEYIERINGEYE